jgi:hypothetical protein
LAADDTTDRLTRLTALRSAQEAAISAGPPLREFTALSAEYRRTLAEIDELTPKEAVGDSIDEIAARRAARRSGPASHPGSAKRPS